MIRLVCLLLLTLFIIGCTGGAQPPSNPDIVATASQQAFDFGAAKTYFLPPDVIEITDSPPASASPTPAPSATPPAAIAAKVPGSIKPAAIDQATKDLILNTIVSNLTARGFVRLTDQAGPKPDFFVQASAMRTTSTTVYYTYWYPYWGTYYDPWYGGYSGYAPYAVPYIENTTVGAVIVEFTNPNSPDSAAQKIPSIWAGVVSGVLDGSAQPEVNQRITDGINQAFEQSPQIRSQR